MATIYKRLNKDGSSTVRVQIRRKDLPIFNISFSCIKEAEKWVELNEYEYIKNPDTYLKWMEKERINLRRKREFER